MWRVHLQVAVLLAGIVGAGLGVGHFLIWTVDRHHGCGGCSYVEYVQITAHEVFDIARHIFVSGRPH